MNDIMLRVENLSTSFFTHLGEVKAVRGVSFTVQKGEVLGIVGESGSGKSITALSILQLLKHPGKVISGRVLFKGESLLDKPEKQMRAMRGNQLSMIFQDPMTSLNPTLTVGEQVMEMIRVHQTVDRGLARKKALELFDWVKIPSPRERLNCYPHEFSGGMRQRVMIAMALCCDPELIIADEPTTALNVTIQEQILKLLRSIQGRLNSSIVLITHDLGVIAELADRILVMYGGMIMEEAPVEDIFYRPRHPYTVGLLESIPQIEGHARRRLIPIPGSPPDMLKPPAGCPFAPRCAAAMRICFEKSPEYSKSKRSRAMCWLWHPQAPPSAIFDRWRKGA